MRDSIGISGAMNGLQDIWLQARSLVERFLTRTFTSSEAERERDRKHIARRRARDIMAEIMNDTTDFSRHMVDNHPVDLSMGNSVLDQMMFVVTIKAFFTHLAIGRLNLAATPASKEIARQLRKLYRSEYHDTHELIRLMLNDVYSVPRLNSLLARVDPLHFYEDLTDHEDDHETVQQESVEILAQRLACQFYYAHRYDLICEEIRNQANNIGPEFLRRIAPFGSTSGHVIDPGEKAALSA